MGAAVLESDDSEPSKGKQPKSDPSKDGPSKDAPKEIGVAESDGTTATATPEPPRKPKTWRGAFEGDVAAVELRARLASTRDGIPRLEAPVFADPASPGLLRLVGFVLAAAAVAGVTGYVVGAFTPSAPSTGPESASSRATIEPASLASGPNPAVTQRDPELPAAQTATIDLAPADARRAAQHLPATGLPATGPRAALPAAASSLRSASDSDASEIAAKMKIGADLMANGDVAAARMMFERAAEAGEAAAAFALAETYDPLVLRTLRLRGAIAPDPALARRWYEKARDLGSSAAPERIARLSQNPR
jgi:hypothetical protein